MSERRGSLLGRGEYELTSVPSELRARELFLEHVADLVPDVLTSLRCHCDVFDLTIPADGDPEVVGALS